MACLVLAVISGFWIAIGGGRSLQSGGGAGGGADTPVARLEVMPSSGLAPLQITASASTSKAGKGATITSYDFNFGDGTSTGQQPKATVKHTYKSPATYTVTLTVTNSAGRTDQTTQDVAVTKPRPGDPTAKLRVRPRTGEAPLQITARASTSSAGKGAKITDYDFNFGDGTSTGPQPKATVQHTYKSPRTYTVTLTVTNSAGRTDQTTQDVTVTKPPPSEPTAKLRVSPRSGQAPLQISASGSTSSAGKGAKITSYDFNFGDGTTTGPQPDPTVQHTYKIPRTYTVTLTVTNSAGRKSGTTQDVTVDEPPPSKPTAELKLSVGEVDPVEPDSPLFIRADGSGSVAGPGATMSSYEFSFSDGYSTGAQKDATVEYECKAGDYTVTLTVTNSAGQTASTKRTIQVG